LITSPGLEEGRKSRGDGDNGFTGDTEQRRRPSALGERVGPAYGRPPDRVSPAITSPQGSACRLVIAEAHSIRSRANARPTRGAACVHGQTPCFLRCSVAPVNPFPPYPPVPGRPCRHPPDIVSAARSARVADDRGWRFLVLRARCAPPWLSGPSIPGGGAAVIRQVVFGVPRDHRKTHRLSRCPSVGSRCVGS
jgi:hypothetical protein